MTEKQITTSEAISEFRKLMRTFEALEHAESVLAALQDKNVMKEALDKELQKLSDEKINLQKEVSKLLKTVEDMKSSGNETRENLKTLVASKTSEANLILAKARAEASVLVESAENKKNALMNEIASLEKEKQLTKDGVISARAELQELQNKIAEEKERIKKAMGF